MSSAPLWIGTSGWIYKHWKEIFYPPEVKQADWLPFFAEHFDTVEVNCSFYRIPTASAVDAWARRTPQGFLFAMKLWRGITHYKKLKNCEKELQVYFGVANRLPPRRRGPLLVQLPPHQGKDLEKLNAFLRDLKRSTGRTKWRVAVEFRNDSWLDSETYRVLDRHNAAVCLHDMLGRGAATEPNDADFVYVRRHGSTGKYAGGYSEDQIREDAERIADWLDRGRSVFVYYNNDVAGKAILNAHQLREALTRSVTA